MSILKHPANNTRQKIQQHQAAWTLRGRISIELIWILLTASPSDSEMHTKLLLLLGKDRGSGVTFTQTIIHSQQGEQSPPRLYHPYFIHMTCQGLKNGEPTAAHKEHINYHPLCSDTVIIFGLNFKTIWTTQWHQ